MQPAQVFLGPVGVRSGFLQPPGDALQLSVRVGAPDQMRHDNIHRQRVRGQRFRKRLRADDAEQELKVHGRRRVALSARQDPAATERRALDAG